MMSMSIYVAIGVLAGLATAGVVGYLGRDEPDNIDDMLFTLVVAALVGACWPVLIVVAPRFAGRSYGKHRAVNTIPSAKVVQSNEQR